MPDAGPAVGVVGRGRLGREVAAACARHGLPVVLTASRSGWTAERVPAVLVDGSGPGAHQQVLEYCRRHRTALVECVSDLDGRQWAALEELAREVPVVRAVNLTVGHWAQQRMTRWFASLGAHTRFPVEVTVSERHPLTKAHRPSATAAELARVWSAAGGEVAGVDSLRGGPPVSDHELLWTWPGQTLALRHSVLDLRAAADGAVAAVRWAAAAGAGAATMRDVYDGLIGTGDDGGAP